MIPPHILVYASLVFSHRHLLYSVSYNLTGLWLVRLCWRLHSKAFLQSWLQRIWLSNQLAASRSYWLPPSHSRSRRYTALGYTILWAYEKGDIEGAMIWVVTCICIFGI